MKKFIDHGFKPIDRVSIDGVRNYATDHGNFPSVTTVVGLHSSKYIEAWRNKVGEEAADRISKKASDRGTRIHQLCEDFLKTGIASPDMFDRDMFDSIKKYVDKIDNIHALETALYSKKLEVAGTVDVIGEYDGILSIIDFKTSSRIKHKSDIHNYFMQASIYGYMFWEMTGIAINNIVIIMGIDDEQPLIFVEKIKDWLPGFIELRKNYKLLKGV